MPFRAAGTKASDLVLKEMTENKHFEDSILELAYAFKFQLMILKLLQGIQDLCCLRKQ